MKKSKKKLLSIFTAMALSTSMFTGALAADDDIQIVINGTELHITEDDTKPFIEDGRTLVPMRAIFEAFGADVDWDEETKTVTSESDYGIIRMQVGNDIIEINGEEVTVDVPAKIVDGRTVVPVRVIAEGLNKIVEWDSDAGIISITDVETEEIPNLDKTEPEIEENKPINIADLHSSIQKETDSPDWVKNLPSAKDEKTTQLFVVAGLGMDKTTATISMHERNENGEWKQILSTPGYVGKNGLCLDADHAEGCGQTPIGVYHFNKAFGIADDPGCELEYVKVTDDTYWSGDQKDGMRYNEMVDINNYPDLDKENSEHIVDYEYQYQYCLNISFNDDGTKGRGSAIFLHCLGPVKPYTGGCVAVPENLMKMIMQRVHEDCVVVIDTVDNLNATL